MASREEDQANVIDIVSIHQKIQHYHHLRNHEVLSSPVSFSDIPDIQDTQDLVDTSDSQIPEDMNDFVFDFYLVQALPLLTIYQQMIKERGKIRFGPASSSSSIVSSSFLPATSPIHSLNVREEETEILIKENKECFRFPVVGEEAGNNKNRSPMEIIREYLLLIERYYPRLYEEMDMAALQKTIVDCPGKELFLHRTNHNESISSNNNVCTSSTFHAEKECTHTNLIMSHENMLVCEKCGFTPEQNNVSTSISFKDINRVNLASKYLYDRITHFKDCINQFQGKQNCTIDKSVYDDLIRQFLLHDLIPENHATIPKETAFQRITKEHIMLFLKDCRHTKHYEDVVLIHSYFTGIQPPDITHLENQLLHDFDQLTCLYDKKHRQQDRKNFINTQYVLYQLLKRHKFPCKKEDFNILKTIDRKFYHDDICKSLFEELHWNFNPTF